MTAKIKISFAISVLAIFAVIAFVIPSKEGIHFAFSAGPTCGTGGVCSVLTTDGSGNFGIGANAITGSKLYIKTGGTGATDFGFRIIDSNSADVLTVAGDGKLKIYKSAGLEFSDGTIQTTAATGGGATSTSAGYITPGYFNSVAGTGGNYSFPASLSIGTSTTPTGGVLFVNGNVGIGTTAPTRKLDILDGTNPQMRLSYSGATYADLKTDSSGNLNIYPLGSRLNVIGNGDQSVYLILEAGGAYANFLSGRGVDSGTAPMFGVAVSDMVGGGIETRPLFSVQSGGVTPLTVKYNAVGIGTTAPQYLLDVYGASNKLGLTYSYTATYGSTGGELSADINGDLHIIATKRFPSVLAKNVLLAENGGKVGIATTTPTYPLTVAGVIHSSTGGYRFPDGTTQTTAASGSGGGGYGWTTSGTNVILATSTNKVGIATTTPTYPLTVAGVIHSSTGGYRFPDGTTQTTAATGGGGGSNYFTLSGSNLYPTSTTYNLGVGTASIDANYKITTAGGGIKAESTTQPAGYFNSTSGYGLIVNTGNVGIGTTAPGAKLEIAGQIKITGGTPGTGKVLTSDATGLASWTTSTGGMGGSGTVGYIPKFTAGTTLGDSIISESGTTITIGAGSGKINVGTVDPPYTINGEQYATYVPSMTGQKEETTGEVRVSCHPDPSADGEGSKLCSTTIDFSKVEKGSDLWLFAKTTNLKNNFSKMTVLLTPSFNGKVWYEKDIKNNVLKIFASPVISDKSLVDSYSVSYRLTAPRFDSAKWLNTRNEAGVDGFIIND